MERKRTLSVFAWILSFFFLTILVDFPIAVPAFVFGYLKLAGKEKWSMTLITNAITWALFDEGYLQKALRLIGW